MSRSPTATCPWVVATHLRDTLLLPRVGGSGVWGEVEKMVRLDSRIGVVQKMVKGEHQIVWEWQGEGEGEGWGGDGDNCLE